MSAIEWTDKTWNPATGCIQISPGCKNCYAKTMSKRLKKMGQDKYKNEFEYTEHEKYLDEPLKWKKSCKIFVNSMSDLFHENATPQFLNKVFDTMMKADWHQYQILTKRPGIMKDFTDNWLERNNLKTVPSHILLGTSIESKEYLYRLFVLERVHGKRFISFEPLLGRIGDVDLKGIDWVIVGGESGVGFRDVIKTEWVEEIKNICIRDNVAFFFKQWGGRYPKAQGNLLEGKIYQEYPSP